MAIHKTITREQLYKDIWAKPAATLSSEYRISGSMIARICTKLNVPRPPRGYWAKKSNGHKTIRRPKLPNATEDHLLEWSISDHLSMQTGRKAALEANEISPDSIPEKEHRMIKATRIALRGEKLGRDGLISPKRTWKHVSLDTSEAQLERALSLLNSFLYLCEETGVEVHCPIQANPKTEPEYYENRTSGAVLLRWEDEELNLSIRETKTRFKEKSEYKWDSYSHSHAPSGFLEIKIGDLRKRDAKRTKLESFISTLAETAIKQMKAAKAHRLAREEEQRRYAFIAEYRDARNKQKRFEEKQHESLLERSASYKHVTELREYIQMCEQQAARLKSEGYNITEDDFLQIQWMKARLEMIDPFLDTGSPWRHIPISVAKGLEPEGYYW